MSSEIMRTDIYPVNIYRVRGKIYDRKICK